MGKGTVKHGKFSRTVVLLELGILKPRAALVRLEIPGDGAGGAILIEVVLLNDYARTCRGTQGQRERLQKDVCYPKVFQLKSFS
jgi:hypothetical protein